MKPYRLSLLHPLWPAVALLVGLILAMSITAAQALPTEPDTPTSLDSPTSPSNVPGAIEGFLYPPPGTAQIPVEGGWIDIVDEAGQPWMGTNTGPGGYFAISNLPAGLYFLTAYPPEGLPFAAHLPLPVEVHPGMWTSVTMHLDYVRISGWVQDCGTGARIEGAEVVAHNEDWSVAQWAGTNVNGEFKIGGVTPGITYILEALPPPESDYVPLGPITVVPTATNVVLELCIPPTNILGTIHDPGGFPVPGAQAFFRHEDYVEGTGADELGNFRFRGLPPGEFWIWAAPPANIPGLLASEPFTIFLATPTSTVNVVITLPHAFKTAIGQVVMAETSDGIPDARVEAHRLDGAGHAETHTDLNGVFTLSLPGGEWHLNAEPLDLAAPWIFPGPPIPVAFELPPTATEEITGVILEVIPASARVQGHVVCPGGLECSGDPEHWRISVELRNDEIANGTELNPAYDFGIPIPPGWYELVIHVAHPRLQGPQPIPVHLGENQVLDVGVIELQAKNARIAGQVHTELGVGISDVPVLAWQPDHWGWGWAKTNASGWYTMYVTAGEWFVEAAPEPEQPFVSLQPPELVRVAPGGLIRPIDFVLTRVDAGIVGAAVDAETGERLWDLGGLAWAERYVTTDTTEFFADAPLENGVFTLKVRGDHWYNIGLAVHPYAPYASGWIGPRRINPGEWVTATVPLQRKNAWIEGQLINALDGTPAFGVWAEVFGHDGRGNWVHNVADSAGAWYELGVLSGTWHLDFWVDPASGYVAGPPPPRVTVAAETGARQDLEVWPIDAWIEGTVLGPDGTGLEGVFVFAQGDSPFVGYFETHAESNADGYFMLHVPEGLYTVGAGLPREEMEARGWLPPPPIEGLYVAADSPAAGLELRFRQLDGEIHGTVTFASTANVTPTHSAFVWGWAESGEWAETEATVVTGTNTFTYTMRVVSDTVWHIGTVYENWDEGVFYKSPEAIVPVLPPDGQATQDLELDGPWSLPQPMIVSFDASQMQTIILPDGVELSIPSGALAVSGTVTLFIFPTQELRPEEGQEMVGPGYEIWAVDGDGQEITQFNQDVFITIHYPDDATLEGLGVSENLLVPVYYSTLAGRWILADSYVLDTENNEITLQIDHFTRFGALAKAEPASIQLTDLEITGPTSGETGASYTFMAAVLPITATGLLPITYTWEATGQFPAMHGRGVTDTMSFAWTTPGRKIITATATNSAYTVSDTHVITISEPPDIHILSPTDGQIFTATNGVNVPVPITVTTENFVIPDDGHWHLWIDGTMIGPVMAYTTTTDLSAGTHVISAELRSPSHVVLGPVDAVTVTVRASSIHILSPMNGQVFTATNNVSATVPITVTTENFAIPDDGHWHLWIDGAMVGPVLAYATTADLLVGAHVISADLRSTSHVALGPVDAVTVIVRGLAWHDVFLPIVLNNR